MILTKKEIAELFKVSQQTVDRWIKKGMPVIKIPGSNQRFDKEEVIAWMKTFEKTTKHNDA